MIPLLGGGSEQGTANDLEDIKCIVTGTVQVTTYLDSVTSIIHVTNYYL